MAETTAQLGENKHAVLTMEYLTMECEGFISSRNHTFINLKHLANKQIDLRKSLEKSHEIVSTNRSSFHSANLKSLSNILAVKKT